MLNLGRRRFEKGLEMTCGRDSDKRVGEWCLARFDASSFARTHVYSSRQLGLTKRTNALFRASVRGRDAASGHASPLMYSFPVVRDPLTTLTRTD